MSRAFMLGSHIFGCFMEDTGDGKPVLQLVAFHDDGNGTCFTTKRVDDMIAAMREAKIIESEDTAKAAWRVNVLDARCAAYEKRIKELEGALTVHGVGNSNWTPR